MIAEIRKRGRLWQARIKIAGWSKERYFKTGLSDKQSARKWLDVKVLKLERQSVGRLPSDAVLEASTRPILDLLDVYLGEVQVQGRAANTVRLYRQGITKICRECGWKCLQQISREGLERWRTSVLAPAGAERRGARAAPLDGGAKRRDGGSPSRRPERAGGSPALGRGEGAVGPFDPRTPRAANTVNHMVGYLRTFMRWCEDREFIEGDPLRRVKPITIKDQGPFRRAITVAELAHFFASVPAHRAAVYTAAYYAGLRRSDLNRLKRGDFYLDGERPFVRVLGFRTKNGKTKDIRLDLRLVPVLRAYWPVDMAPFAWAFYGHVPNMDTWRRDLGRAGIPYKDAEGRRFDFHALRTTLNTHLRDKRVSLEDRMAILRWSEPRLARETYMDERQIAVAGELAKLDDVTKAVDVPTAASEASRLKTLADSDLRRIVAVR